MILCFICLNQYSFCSLFFAFIVSNLKVTNLSIFLTLVACLGFNESCFKLLALHILDISSF